jgi:hypothetical protein
MEKFMDIEKNSLKIYLNQKNKIIRAFGCIFGIIGKLSE